MEPVPFYRPRNPRTTPLWKLAESHYERLRRAWEERFEARFGLWRGLADEAVARYLDCGIPELGFARLRCDTCRRERLLTFSCRTRQLCPSCGAKRGVIFEAFLREEVVEPAGHAQWVFTIPKILRGYFLRNRELLGDLSRVAWETVRALMAEAAGDPGVRPGMVVVPQTFGSSVNAHPHVHAIASRGAWTTDGTWVPIPYVDSGAAARLFRHKVLRLLLDAALIDEERVAMILGWRHTSGFSVHNEVVVQPGDGDGLERLARYLTPPPVSLQRMEWDRETGDVLYRTGRGHAEECGSEDVRRDDVPDDVERIDELEFLARVVTQLPEPRKHSIRYYGYYAAVVRAKRRRALTEAEAPVASSGDDAVGSDVCEARRTSGGVRPAFAAYTAVASEPDTAERKQLRKTWAALIRRVYEVDPLLCPCGATMRRVAIITERSVITKILAHLAKVAAKSSTELLRSHPWDGPKAPSKSSRRCEPVPTLWTRRARGSAEAFPPAERSSRWGRDRCWPPVSTCIAAVATGRSKIVAGWSRRAR